MNEEILIEKIKYLTSMPHSSLVEHCIYLEDENNKYKVINKLQSNWNSLREYIGKEWYCFDNESVEFEVAKNILDKMNELEKRNEN